MSMTKYNPNYDYENGFNEEPEIDFQDITDEDRQAALDQVQELIDSTRQDLGGN